MLHADPRSRCSISLDRASILFVALVAAALAARPAAARESDPIRNSDPEQPIPPDQVENPIYYTMPAGSVGEVRGVVPEALLEEFLNLHTSMNYPAAVEAAMRLVAAVPDRPIGYYNLACALARLQRLDEAFDALQQAIDQGWRDVIHLGIDPDLASMRSDARFSEVRRAVDAHIESERIASAPLRTDPWQAVASDLNRDLPPLLARYHVPGAAVALIEGGEMVWSAAFGQRDTRDEQSLSADDRFRLRSPLHLLAIAACARLEQEQRLQFASLLIDAANQCGAPFQLEARGVKAGERGVIQPANIRDSSPFVPRRSGREHVAGAPMTMMGYSRHSAYGFLRLAIEEAAEGPFTEYCERAIFPSAGLQHTGFAAPQEPVHTAIGHSVLGTPLRPSVMPNEFAPGGSVHITAGDLARLIAEAMPEREVPTEAAQGLGMSGGGQEPIFDGPAGDDGGGFAAAIETVTQADAALSGALGWAIRRQETADGVRMQMEESSSGIVLLARWHPQARRGVVVLCNAVTGGGAAERIAHLALGGEQ